MRAATRLRVHCCGVLRLMSRSTDTSRPGRPRAVLRCGTRSRRPPCERVHCADRAEPFQDVGGHATMPTEGSATGMPKVTRGLQVFQPCSASHDHGMLMLSSCPGPVRTMRFPSLPLRSSAQGGGPTALAGPQQLRMAAVGRMSSGRPEPVLPPRRRTRSSSPAAGGRCPRGVRRLPRSRCVSQARADCPRALRRLGWHNRASGRRSTSRRGVRTEYPARPGSDIAADGTADGNVEPCIVVRGSEKRVDAIPPRGCPASP
jgi:hypothetical protein